MFSWGGMFGIAQGIAKVWVGPCALCLHSQLNPISHTLSTLQLAHPELLRAGQCAATREESKPGESTC